MTVDTKNAILSEIVSDGEKVGVDNPLAVNIVAGGGAGGGGGGTEYIEDAAAPANPTGGLVMAVRKDTLSATEVSADGDVIALKATNKGQLHVYAEVVGGGGGGTSDATAANQTAIQADAGSDAAKVVAVQGVTNGKAVKVDGSAVTQPISSTQLTSIDGKLPSSLGAKSAATSLAVTASTEDQARIGSVTETAPASDTASSGLNGRLQRVAQRMTSLIALLPTSLGQKTKSASLAVSVASDDDLHTKLGEVQTTPTANTLLGRLKDLTTNIVLATGNNIIGRVGIDQTTAGTTNGVVVKDSAGTAISSGNPLYVRVATSSALATETTLQSVLTELQTPGTSMPKQVLETTSDLTYVFDSSSASTDRTLVTATSGQTTRVHQMIVSAAGATTVQFKDGAAGTVLFTLEFPAAGAYAIPFNSRPYIKTSANTLLAVASTAAVKTTVGIFYIKSA